MNIFAAFHEVSVYPKKELPFFILFTAGLCSFTALLALLTHHYPEPMGYIARTVSFFKRLSTFLLFNFILGHQRGFAAIALYSGKIGSFLSVESPAAFVACLNIAEISTVWGMSENLASNLFSVSRSTYIFRPTLLSLFLLCSYERVLNPN